MSRSLKTTLAAVALSSALVLAGCGNGGDDKAGHPGGHPGRTESQAAMRVDVPEEKPTKVVAVSSETADMALLLTGPDNIAAISETSQNPAMGMVPDLAKQVEKTLPSSNNPDAEQILSFKPDLVIMTARHGGEQNVGEQLANAGVALVELPSENFSTPEKYADTLVEVGKALHQEDKAAEEAKKLKDAIAKIDKEAGVEGGAAESQDGPSVLGLMSRGGKVMAMDKNQMLPGLAIRAGAKDAAGAIGVKNSRPIDAEQLLAANPGIILVEDFMGAGMKPFEEMLSSEAVKDVPAIKNDRVELVKMTEASGIAGVNLPTGYQKIVEIVRG